MSAMALTYLVLLVLATGATARLTRLVTTDRIAASARAAIVRRTGSGLVHELITCAWCVGFWISCAVVAAAWAVAGLPLSLGGLTAAAATALTVSYLVGLLANVD